MLDIKFIRENKDLVKDAAKKKRIEFDVDELLKVDDERRKFQSAFETKRAEQNKFNEKISSCTDFNQRTLLIAEMRSLKDSLQKDEADLKEVVKKWQLLMLKVPNVPDMSVPDGEDDSKNLEIRTWGEVPKFTFTPKSHTDLMESLDMADLERGTKVAGFRGWFLKGDGALLHFAIMQFVIDQFVAKGDFTPMITPTLVKREPFLGTGYLPQGEEDLYKTQDDLYLTGTAEVPTMGYYMDEILEKKNLPVKFVSFSPCFRREAGSHGKDTKGVVRVHEFYKIEQVVLCEARHDKSVKFHEALTENSEKILQALKVPYRVVVNCGGDLGLGQVKKYDIEAWVPSEGKYRETHSSSYFHDFQTRRLNIRYKDDDGKIKFVHSLNNTAIASPRILVPVIENYQREDGTIAIPEVLQKYLGGRKFMEKRKK